MTFTAHAQDRGYQRGISPFAVNLVIDYGAVEYHKGREIYRLDKKGFRKLRQYLGKLEGGYVSMLKDIYVVMDGASVITVARRNRHHKRDRH